VAVAGHFGEGRGLPGCDYVKASLGCLSGRDGFLGAGGLEGAVAWPDWELGLGGKKGGLAGNAPIFFQNRSAPSLVIVWFKVIP